MKQQLLEFLQHRAPKETAITAGLVVTLTPLVLLQCLPRRLPPNLLAVLIGFAVGTLLGDVFLHVLPFVFMASGNEHHHHHQHNHEHTGHHHHGDSSVGLSILGGLTAFLVLDKFIRVLTGGHHHHHHAEEDEPNGRTSPTGSSPISKGASSPKQRRKTRSKSKQEHTHDHHHEHGTSSSSGYLTLLANVTHTFTDGLTLATSHYANPLIAFSTTLAVLLHEVPHKVGDYAILLKSGFSQSRALAMQLLMALGTMSGILFGVWIQEAAHGDQTSAFVEQVEKSLIPFTAGGLIFTACVSLLPELVETKSLSTFSLQLVSMVFGYSLMAWVAEHE